MPIRLTAHLQGLQRSTVARDRTLRRETLRRAMEDSLQIIYQSTMMGYVKRVAPDGTPWAPNAPWYAEMKGQNSPLIGPVSRTIQGGRYAGLYEFQQVSIKRMMQSVEKINHTTTGVLQYERAAQSRATLQQHGGSSEMTIIRKSGYGRGPELYNVPPEVTFHINVQARPHLGLATYPRIQPRTDAQWVEFYFGEQVEIQLRDDFGDGRE